MRKPKIEHGSQRATCTYRPASPHTDIISDHGRDGAIDIVKEYFEEIGGRPEPKGQKRKGRQSGIGSESGTPASTTKRVKQEKQWSPPPGSWEHEISHVDTIEESINPKTGKLERFAYLVWNNQKKTQHPLQHTYQKCPQKVRA